MLKKLTKNIGPGSLVAAAFIGPGTITTCTTAGARFGYDLMWALVLSVIATISLQEMAARLGVISQKDLASVIAKFSSHRVLQISVITLILCAIVVGNTSYEAGNISGAALGLELFTGKLIFEFKGASLNLSTVILGAIAFMILVKGSIKSLQQILLGLVMLMSMAFVLTAILTKPNLFAIFRGLLSFKSSDASLFTVVGLIGTTVVPYNLFLHSALVAKKWHSPKDLQASRWDTFVAVLLGGLVSMSVLIAAASVNILELKSGADLAFALQTTFGESAKYFMGLGLIAAGLTSAVTAPLAAAFVITGLFGKSGQTNSKLYKAVWMSVLLFGILVSSFNLEPIVLIIFAQVTNGLFLPFIVLVLLWIMNQTRLLGSYKNTKLQNAFGIFVFLLTLLLAYRILINSL
jgi:Mn2+/Fe2+ NRAMP family transporter